MDKTPIYCWRGTDGDNEPLQMKCLGEFGWPNQCVDKHGNVEDMYINTHFLKKEDAWESIVKSKKAMLQLSYRRLDDAKKEMQAANKQFKAAQKEWNTVMKDPNNPHKDKFWQL